jgi:hypothetical protein
LRRGVKTVPVSDQMREIIQRDDEANFDFDQRHETVTLTPPPAPPPAPKAITSQPGQSLPDSASSVPKADPAPAAEKPKTNRRKAPAEPPQEAAPAPEPPPTDVEPELPRGWSAYLDQMVDELRGASSPEVENGVHDTVSDGVAGAVERAEISATEADLIRAEWEKRSAAQ